MEDAEGSTYSNIVLRDEALVSANPLLDVDAPDLGLLEGLVYVLPTSAVDGSAITVSALAYEALGLCSATQNTLFLYNGDYNFATGDCGSNSLGLPSLRVFGLSAAEPLPSPSSDLPLQPSSSAALPPLPTPPSIPDATGSSSAALPPFPSPLSIPDDSGSSTVALPSFPTPSSIPDDSESSSSAAPLPTPDDVGSSTVATPPITDIGQEPTSLVPVGVQTSSVTTTGGICASIIVVLHVTVSIVTSTPGIALPTGIGGIGVAPSGIVGPSVGADVYGCLPSHRNISCIQDSSLNKKQRKLVKQSLVSKQARCTVWSACVPGHFPIVFRVWLIWYIYNHGVEGDAGSCFCRGKGEEGGHVHPRCIACMLRAKV